MRNHLTIAAVLGLLGLGAGCVPNEATVFSPGICAPATDPANCAPDGECERVLTDSVWGYLRVQTGGGTVYDSGLGFFVQLNNQRTPNGGGGAVNTAYAQIKRYDIKYLYDGVEIGSTFVEPTWNTIPPGGTFTPFVWFIPPTKPNYSAELQDLIAEGAGPFLNIEVTFKGEYLDQTSFESGPISLQAQVINDVFGDDEWYGCKKEGDVVTLVCPNVGQSATYTCETPEEEEPETP